MAPVIRSTITVLSVLCAALFLIVVDAEPPAKQFKCHNITAYPKCPYRFYCPASCPDQCVVDCELCRSLCSCDKPGWICQDPRFVGGDGITFYFHGKKDRDFCLVSDSNVHINAHFIGKRDPAMTRDFTWVQAIAVLFDGRRLYVGAQKTATWDNAVDHLSISYDGETVDLPTAEGASWRSSSLPELSIVRSSVANVVVIEAEGKFRITARVVPISEEESRVHNYGITADDCFAHLELGFKFYSLTGDVHGVLGQTYREGYVSRVNISSAMPLMGGDRSFSTSNLFAPDCAVSRFARAGSGIAMPSELAAMDCGSGLRGRGIVCKK